MRDGDAGTQGGRAHLFTLADGVQDRCGVVDLPRVLRDLHQFLEHGGLGAGRQRHRRGGFGHEGADQGLLVGVAAGRPLFQPGQLIFRVGGHLGFEPVADLGRVEAVFAGDLVSGQIAAAGPLLHFARVAL